MLNFNNIGSGIEIDSQPLEVETGTIPHRIAVFGFANESFKTHFNAPIEITDFFDASETFGVGSQLAHMVRSLDNVAAKIECFALEKPSNAKERILKIAASKAPTNAGKLILFIDTEKIVITFEANESQQDIFKRIEDAIVERPYLPVTAKANNSTDVSLTSRFAGDIANDINLEVGGDKTDFTTTDTKATGGLPDLDKAYKNLKNVWYTMAVLPFSDKDALKKIEKYAQERDDVGIKLPILNVAGCKLKFSEAKKIVESLDSPFLQVVCVPETKTINCVIAADEVYKRIMCSQIQPNISGRNLALRYTHPPQEYWTPSQKEAFIQAGGSTVDSRFGNVFVDNETTTSKTIEGRENDMWRWASTVICNMAKLYSLKKMFQDPPFDDYLIVDDGTCCGSSKALKPSMVKQYVASLMAYWVRSAWSKNLEDMLNSIRVSVPKGNAQSYFIEYMDDFAVSGKRIFVRYMPKISSKV